MNVSALARNWRRASSLCPSISSRAKFVLWTYGFVLAAAFWRNHRTTLQVVLPNPVGKLDLEVRANCGSDAFIFSEVFEHWYYDLQLPFMPRTILDLGGNVGFSAIYFARKYPRAALAVVEPVPTNVEVLRANLRRNDIEATVIPKAICVRRGTIEMHASRKDYGHKVADMCFGTAVDGERFVVEAETIEHLLKVLAWERIGLLKVDIEGYEGVLLADAPQWLNRVDAMCIECHEGFEAAQLARLALTFGFETPQRLAGTWLLRRNAQQS